MSKAPSQFYARRMWLPLPIFALAIGAFWRVGWRESYESLSVLLTLNLVFTTAVFLFISVLAGRTFLSKGQPGILMLGCAMVLWGGTAFLASVGCKPGNENITTHNLGMASSAICHLVGVLLAGGSRPMVRPGVGRLALGYLGAITVVGFIWVATILNWLPLFFIEGQGGTPVRNLVIGTSIAVFLIAAGLAWSRHLRTPSPFLAWYAAGLGLVAVGAGGLMIQTVHGGILGWISRSAQWLGGIYMLTGAVLAARQARAWELPLPAELMEADYFRQTVRAVVLWPIAWGVALLFIVLGLLSYLLDSAHWVDHSNEVLARISRVEKASVDMETGLRGFEFTGERDFLEPFDHARAVLPGELGALQALVRDNPDQTTSASELGRTHGAWMSYATDARARVFMKTPADVKFELRGEHLMDDFRARIGAMQQYEQRLLATRSRTLALLETAFLMVILLVAFVLVPLLAFSLHRALVRVNSAYRHSLEEVRVAGERANNILESLTDAFQTVDGGWHFTSMNSASRQILTAQGLDPGTLIGKNFWEVFPATVGSKLERVYRCAMAERKSATLEYFYEPWQRWYDIRISPIREGGLSISFGDITGRKQAEEALRASEEQLAVELADTKLLQRLSAQFVSEGDVATVYEAVLDTAVAIMRSDFASMQTLYPERGRAGELRLLGIRGFPPEAAKFWEWVGADSKCPCGLALRTGERVIVTDVGRCEFVAGADREAFRQAGIRGMQSTPLASRSGKILGMISTHWREPHQPSERDLRLLDILARQATDLIERKSGEEKLRESEERFRQMADNIAPLAWMTDEKGWIFWYNKRWYEYTGTTFEEMQGWGWERAHDPAELARMLPAWKNALATGNPWEDIFPLRRHDGKYGWFLSRAFPMRDTSGKITRWFGTNVDITELRESKEALQRAQEELQLHARRLEQTVAERTARLRETVSELETFSYSIAHDMRAPLRAMQGFSNILQDRYADQIQGTGRDYLRRIGAAANRLDALIQDVLNYSKVVRAELPLESVNTEEFIQQIVESYPNLHPPSAEIRVEGPIPSVLANPAALTQVVSNLLGNAVKFVQSGVKPEVRVWAEEVRADLRPANGADGEKLNGGRPMARLCFEDNGIGIPKEVQERIFMMFQRLHPLDDYEGTGIGLTIVRKAVERMGGRVGVESEPGKGSRFWIELQRAQMDENGTNSPRSKGGKEAQGSPIECMS